MKKFIRIPCLLLLLAVLTTTGPVQGGELDLSLNSDAVRLAYAWPIRGDKLSLDAGLLHQQDLGEIAHFGLHLVDFASDGPNPLRAGLGGRLYYTNSDTVFDDELTLALGGFVNYTLPDYNRFSIGARIYYAPEILTFGDSEEFIELDARISYNVLRDADVFLGARYIGIEFQGGGKLRLDTGLHAGIQLRF